MISFRRCSNEYLNFSKLLICVIWTYPIITGGVLWQTNPEPCSEMIFAIDEHAAITDGSSIAIGTR